MVPGGHEGQAGGEEIFRLLEVGLEGGDRKADERGGGSGEGVQADRVDALAQSFFFTGSFCNFENLAPGSSSFDQLQANRCMWTDIRQGNQSVHYFGNLREN